jgi:hypothetical protein
MLASAVKDLPSVLCQRYFIMLASAVKDLPSKESKSDVYGDAYMKIANMPMTASRLQCSIFSLRYELYLAHFKEAEKLKQLQERKRRAAERSTHLMELKKLEQLQERKRFRKWEHVYAPPPPKARSSTRWQR